MLGPQFTARPERRCRRSGLPQGGTASMPVREKGTNGTGTRASRPVSRPCARAERRETAGLSTHRHGIHCTDKLRAGGRWIRTSDSRSRGGQTVMRDCLENRSGSVGEPKVRMHLPPAWSQLRTLLSGATADPARDFSASGLRGVFWTSPRSRINYDIRGKMSAPIRRVPRCAPPPKPKSND